MNHELMSSLWLSSTGMHLYWYMPSKWLGQLDDTFSKAEIPMPSSMSFLEAWYALPRYRNGRISTGPPCCKNKGEIQHMRKKKGLHLHFHHDQIKDVLFIRGLLWISMPARLQKYTRLTQVCLMINKKLFFLAVECGLPLISKHVWVARPTATADVAVYFASWWSRLSLGTHPHM